MRRLLLIAAVTAIAVAKPESYREKEDFQYSRSSSDDGTKSGYYGAQRGNMGGNFERAHNMDTLAQHQLSGAVRQVEGDLGEGAKSKTGSVYTAANTRGVYGSGHYDLSNLEGRNFHEGVSFGDTQASSLSHDSGYAAHSTSHNSQYTSGHTHNSRYTGISGQAEQSSQARNLQSIDNQDGAGQYDYGNQQSSGYYSRSGYERQSHYENTNTNQHGGYGSNAQTRLISGTPVKIVIRPGTRVAIPVAAQTYDANNAELQHNVAISSNHNSLHSEAEVLNTDNQQIYYVPSSKPKHYESSYKYHKEWEKHDTQPVPLAIPTPNPFPKTNELYDDTQIAHQTGSRYQDSRLRSNNDYSQNAHREYNARTASTSQLRQNSGYADLQTSGSGTNSNLFTHGTYNLDSSANKNSITIDDSKPKSYHSSFAYHKSWERQGDPYVIKPATNGVYDEQRSQKLTASNQAAYSSSHQYGSRSHQTHQSYLNGGDCDCDENGHIRVSRSYNQDEVQQQAQNNWENFEQQNQWDQLGQQTQNLWDQQSQSDLSKSEGLGQQSQNKWDNLEDLGQQAQNEWNQNTQSGLAKLEDFGQQSQNKWDNLEDLGQQTQNNWDQQSQQGHAKLEDLGQQTQNNWDQQSQQGHAKLEDLGQQTQNLGSWDKFEKPGRRTQNQPDIWDKAEASDKIKLEKEENLDEIRQNYPKITDQHSQGQSSTNKQRYHQGEQLVINENKENFHKLDSFNHFSNTPYLPNPSSNIDEPQQTFNNGVNEQQKVEIIEQNHHRWHHVDQNVNLDQQNQHFWVAHDNLYNFPTPQQIKPVWEQNEEISQTDETYGSGLYHMPWTFQEKPPSSHHHHHYDQHHHHYDFFGQQSQTNVANNNWNTNEHTGLHKHHSLDETFPSHPHGTSSIQNLWDKINNIESFSNSVNNKKNDFNVTDNEYTKNENSENSNTWASQSTSNLTEHKPQEPYFSVNKKYTTTTENPTKSLNPIEILPAKDIGRGDIGAEDSLNHAITTSTEKTIKNEHNPNIFTTDFSNKPYKTPAEIEVLSLTNENNAESTTKHNTSQENSLNVLSLKEQNEIGQKNTIYTSSTTPKAFNIFQENVEQVQQSYKESNHQLGTNKYHIITPAENTELDYIPKEFEVKNLDQQNKEFNQQDKQVQNNQFQQQNTHTHSLPNLKPQTDNLNSQNQNYQSPIEETLHNTDQQAVNLGQQNEFLNQQYQSWVSEIEQQNTGQQLVDFGQESENLNQQSEPSVLENEQQNIGQQLVDFGQQSENLNQHNEPMFSKTEEQNMGQQLIDFGQQSENLDQQIVPLETEDQNMGQQLEDLSQQNNNINQQTQSQWEKPQDIELIENGQPNKHDQQHVQELGSFRSNDPKQHFHEEKYHPVTLSEQQNMQKVKDQEKLPEKITEVEITSPEPTTEKPGFWKSVGVKFTSAKDKVASWFKSS